MRFAKEHLLGRKVPVMKNHAHDEDVCGRQLILKEVPCYESHAIRQIVRSNVAREYWPHLGQIETAGSQMRMSERQTDRNTPCAEPTSTTLLTAFHGKAPTSASATGLVIPVIPRRNPSSRTGSA